MNTTLTGGDLLGWFDIKDIYNFSNNIDSAVYAFGVFDKVPDKTLLPIVLEDVLYIGQTGGTESIFDRKNKSTGKGLLQTSFHKRMKDHICREKIKLIREDYTDTRKVVCVYIITPKKHMDTTSLKPWLLMSESEIINNYTLVFNKSPRYNYAHFSNRSNIDPNSYSQKRVREIKECSLEKYCG